MGLPGFSGKKIAGWRLPEVLEIALLRYEDVPTPRSPSFAPQYFLPRSHFTHQPALAGPTVLAHSLFHDAVQQPVFRFSAHPVLQFFNVLAQLAGAGSAHHAHSGNNTVRYQRALHVECRHRGHAIPTLVGDHGGGLRKPGGVWTECLHSNVGDGNCSAYQRCDRVRPAHLGRQRDLVGSRLHLHRGGEFDGRVECVDLHQFVLDGGRDGYLHSNPQRGGGDRR